MVSNKIHSKWRIVEMGQWDNEYIDEQEPGYTNHDKDLEKVALKI